MLRKLRADWRRGRAKKYIRFGEPYNYTWETTTAGEILVRVRFDVDGDALVMTILEIGAVSVGSTERVELGMREIRGMLEWVAGMASDLDYSRLRVQGPRTKRTLGHQRFEFGLERYRRGRKSSG